MHKMFKVNLHALVKNGSSKILILQQEGKWMLPGGRLEEDSTPEEGLQRELKEEAGLNNIQIEGVYDTGISSSGQTFLVTYKVRVQGEPKIQISKEHSAYAWIDADTIDEYEFHYEANKKKIQEYLD